MSDNEKTVQEALTPTELRLYRQGMKDAIRRIYAPGRRLSVDPLALINFADKGYFDNLIFKECLVDELDLKDD